MSLWKTMSHRGHRTMVKEKASFVVSGVFCKLCILKRYHRIYLYFICVQCHIFTICRDICISLRSDEIFAYSLVFYVDIGIHICIIHIYLPVPLCLQKYLPISLYFTEISAYVLYFTEISAHIFVFYGDIWTHLCILPRYLDTSLYFTEISAHMFLSYRDNCAYVFNYYRDICAYVF